MKISSSLSQEIACKIIESVGSSGLAPAYGLEYFTAGLDAYLEALKTEYFEGVLKASSTAKLVVGAYGGGKTHFLYCVRNLAWKENFVVSYVSLTESESPFHQIENIYKAIVKNLLRPMTTSELASGQEGGIESFLRYWYDSKRSEFESKGFSDSELDEVLKDYARQQIRSYDSTSFTNAIRHAFLALHEKEDEKFDELVLWLKGEGWDTSFKAKYKIFQIVDKHAAPSLIRSLAEWINSIGFGGLALLFDEAEKVPSLNSKQADQLSSNLREFIDETKREQRGRVLIFYAVPDEGFLQRKGQTYEALKQRFAKFFDLETPTGTKIDLQRITPTEMESKAFLNEVGLKLSEVYRTCYGVDLSLDALEPSLKNLIDAVWEKRYGDVSYRRIFVQSAVSAFDTLRKKKSSTISLKDAKNIVANVLK